MLLDFRLTKKNIQEKCGSISYKRGEAFFRADKVRIDRLTSDSCEATVLGGEDFKVKIRKKPAADYSAECSCPSLASYQKDCQHIAAVMLALLESETPCSPQASIQTETIENYELTDSLITIFQDQASKKPSGNQRFFENREELDVEFNLVPIKDQILVSMKVGGFITQEIRTFLSHVKSGKGIQISQTLFYDPNQYYFSTETDQVIQQLILVLEDRQTFEEAGFLQVPPSIWHNLVPLLSKVTTVLQNGNLVQKFEMEASEKLPISFDVSNSESGGYKLTISGIHEITLLLAYNSVLSNGKFFLLEKNDINRLYELKQMLANTRANEIPIHQNQKGFFLEKVVPGLRRLGEVNLSLAVTQGEVRTPLVAKLYLDRVKNRLLAGLEFQYKEILINPLDSKGINASALLLRDTEKENQILELMEEASFTPTEEGYFLHNEELEYEFLYHIFPKLEHLVQTYATTAVRNRIFREDTPPKISVKVKKERTNWLEFKFQLKGISDQEIRELLEALEEKRKYYRVRNGALMSLETKEYEEIQRFLQAGPVQMEKLPNGFEVPFIEGLQLLDSVDDNVFILEESFRSFMYSLQTPDLRKIVIPERFEQILHDYQKEGFRWLKNLAYYGFGGILADDMGLGKTVQSIAFIFSELSIIRSKRQPALIVCPSAVTYNWLSEFMKFAPDIQAVVVDGNQKERANLQKDINNIDVIIVSYPLLRKDIQWYEKQMFHAVFFDEAQAFKNPVTQTARAVKKIQADHRFALTGTPIENSIEELWSIFYVVFPALFKGLKEYAHLSREKIARRIRPFLLRRVKEDVLSQLPEKVELRESVELFPEQKKLYAAYLAKLRQETLKHLDKDTLRKNKIKILAGLTRLRQICCHPALFVDGYKGSSAKFEQLLMILKESQLSGRRVLVFSQFTKMLDLIGKELSALGYSYFYLDGQTPSEERVNLCSLFNNGERDMFLVSLKAGGTGLNLTGADTVILYDLWWNPAVEEQAADRAHRMGQQNEVQVIKLVARGTIEEKINELQDRKRNLIEEIIDPKKQSGSTLTEEDIREILMI